MKNILWGLLFPCWLFSQTQLQGIVKTADTEQAIEGASVFFNHSSIGTTSNILHSFPRIVLEMLSILHPLYRH